MKLLLKEVADFKSETNGDCHRRLGAIQAWRCEVRLFREEKSENFFQGSKHHFLDQHKPAANVGVVLKQQEVLHRRKIYRWIYLLILT